MKGRCHLMNSMSTRQNLNRMYLNHLCRDGYQWIWIYNEQMSLDSMLLAAPGTSDLRYPVLKLQLACIQWVAWSQWGIWNVSHRIICLVLSFTGSSLHVSSSYCSYPSSWMNYNLKVNFVIVCNVVQVNEKGSSFSMKCNVYHLILGLVFLYALLVII